MGFVGMINTTLMTLPHGVEYDTVYPASSNLTGAFLGAEDIERYVTAGVDLCPMQKYALMGYSQGASVVNIALGNIIKTNPAAVQAIKAVVNIGNPGHVPNAIANVDQNGGNTTRAGLGWYYLGGAGAIPNIYYLDDKVLDICYQGDTVCDVPTNGSGSVLPPHLLYGSTPKVQQMGADFIVYQLQDYSFNSTAISPTYSSTASASVSTCTAGTSTNSSGGASNVTTSVTGAATVASSTGPAASPLIRDAASSFIFAVALAAWVVL